MITFRNTAILAGVLFIIATASSLTSFMGILDPILTRPDYLTQIAEQRSLVVTGVLAELINNAAVAAIGVVLYPVLRGYSLVLALGYITMRFTEAIFITIGDISFLTLIPVAEAYVAGGAQNAATYQIVGDTLKSVADWIFLIGPGIFLAINAFILNYVLWRARLVPWLISVWGMAAAVSLFVGDILGMYGIGDVLIFAAPFALQEMVMALWFVAKGFEPQAVRALSAG